MSNTCSWFMAAWSQCVRFSLMIPKKFFGNPDIIGNPFNVDPMNHNQPKTACSCQTEQPDEGQRKIVNHVWAVFNHDSIPLAANESWWHVYMPQAIYLALQLHRARHSPSRTDPLIVETLHYVCTLSWIWVACMALLTKYVFTWFSFTYKNSFQLCMATTRPELWSQYQTPLPPGVIYRWFLWGYILWARALYYHNLQVIIFLFKALVYI